MRVGQLVVVCAVTAAWAVSFGLGSQAVSHWLKAHDASDTLVGLVHAAYYLGVAVASLLATVWGPRLLVRLRGAGPVIANLL